MIAGTRSLCLAATFASSTIPAPASSHASLLPQPRPWSAPRSSSATIAIIPAVSRLAWGMAAATKPTSAFSKPSNKCASRDRRSSFAITNLPSNDVLLRHAAGAVMF